MKEDFILKVIEQFEKGDTVFLQIRQDDSELVLKKEGAFPKKEVSVQGGAQAAYPMPLAMPAAFQAGFQGVPQTAPSGVQGAAPQPASPVAEAPAQAATASSSADLIEVKSPIVGTFYRAPSPDSPPYVEKGGTVKKGQPLCVLEAMKMMNTLECEHDGVIEEILVSNGELVEFDQVLFKIKAK
ncbi:acetyl-CoA carboxylase biotin carboxyl carrier protein [Treponema sp. OMZ 792]|uniref:acetyl-CoA carboxylase biotin carboxyl carrier protein n=1 Tax=unclassified Treponema TaxID=2638727 RepID=UPI0020A60452|nr:MULTISPECIES: acetyl-CoA carboxylase biotin carboxyl carrier protein [unclassified Treponema]UTC74679.1 acetyl-CoA carboxylase biotin carboxyl carrier protein [Treponema sp. OMZ 792]UTC81073.1 acetyl-CoA carboxylase biotin carboxyl carrier protein [Treponema sp. OMZ 798]